jgi:hypothetical protein
MLVGVIILGKSNSTPLGLLNKTIEFYRYEPIGNEVGPNPATRDGYESLKVKYLMSSSL